MKRTTSREPEKEADGGMEVRYAGTGEIAARITLKMWVELCNRVTELEQKIEP